MLVGCLLDARCRNKRVGILNGAGDPVWAVSRIQRENFCRSLMITRELSLLSIPQQVLQPQEPEIFEISFPLF